ncbi:MAG: NAD(P)H-dependent oxidoreductase subunit E [Armatimonadota bacterium]|nr:NAD(P)H-dependent oxidoreductase subunit E [Armatimonadota bacterium]
MESLVNGGQADRNPSEADLQSLLDELNVCDKSNLFTVLQNVQKRFGYLSPRALEEISSRTGIRLSQIYGVTTFFSLLRTEKQGRFALRFCNSASCYLGGAEGLLGACRELLEIGPGKTTSDGMFSAEAVGCLGACGAAPAMMINDRLYTQVTTEKLAGLVYEIRSGRMPEADGVFGSGTVRALGDPVMTGLPMTSDEKFLLRSLTPATILAAVEASGLRGRGGAAFSAGRKWRLCAETPADQRYVVCNADEGEPGTFKDRYLLLKKPDLLLAGMAMAARAVGASKGYIYLRGEYSDAERTLREEIARFDWDAVEIELVTGAGAYICGEETALLESVEGRRGVPRLRPPYPPVSGLFGKPTVINNVETLASVPFILARGAEWYKGLGSAESPGVKLFSVSGDVERPGVIEAPLGIPLADILSEAGAGELKAALVGGASGRLVSAEEFGRRLCYEDLSPGAGAIIAVGANRSVRELATNLMAFFEEESCGECAPCRIGTARAREILAGELRVDGALAEVLSSMGKTLASASRCGLGQAAPNALLDAIRLFPGEFE